MSLLWKAKEEGAGNVSTTINPPGNAFIVSGVDYTTQAPRLLNGDAGAFEAVTADAIVQGNNIPANTRVVEVVSDTQVRIDKDVTGNGTNIDVTFVPTAGLRGGRIRHLSATVFLPGANSAVLVLSMAPGNDSAFPSFSWYQEVAANKSAHITKDFLVNACPAWDQGTVTISASVQDVGQDPVTPAGLGLLVGFEYK